MTTMTVMPRDHADWTVDDLDRLPDDGLQYELLDGILLVSPAPIVRHQVVAANLFSCCGWRAPTNWWPSSLPWTGSRTGGPRCSPTCWRPAVGTSRNEA